MVLNFLYPVVVGKVALVIGFWMFSVARRFDFLALFEFVDDEGFYFEGVWVFC
jgi:hypothetical protein